MPRRKVLVRFFLSYLSDLERVQRHHAEEEATVGAGQVVVLLRRRRHPELGGGHSGVPGVLTKEDFRVVENLLKERRRVVVRRPSTACAAGGASSSPGSACGREKLRAVVAEPRVSGAVLLVVRSLFSLLGEAPLFGLLLGLRRVLGSFLPFLGFPTFF